MNTRALRHWSARSPAKITSIFPKSKAPALVDASPNRTSLPSSRRELLQPAPVAAVPSKPAASSASREAGPAAIPGDTVPLTNMRRIIAQRMIESRRTSAHVHCMFQVDITRIVNLRNKAQSGFEQRTGSAPHLHAIFCAGDHYRLAAISHRQRIARRRQHSLPPPCQHRNRCRSRLGVHCSCAQECR